MYEWVSPVERMKVIFDQNALVKEMDYPEKILYTASRVEDEPQEVRTEAGSGPRLVRGTAHSGEVSFQYQPARVPLRAGCFPLQVRSCKNRMT